MAPSTTQRRQHLTRSGRHAWQRRKKRGGAARPRVAPRVMRLEEMPLGVIGDPPTGFAPACTCLCTRPRASMCVCVSVSNVRVYLYMRVRVCMSVCVYVCNVRACASMRWRSGDARTRAEDSARIESRAGALHRSAARGRLVGPSQRARAARGGHEPGGGRGLRGPAQALGGRRAAQLSLRPARLSPGSLLR